MLGEPSDLWGKVRRQDESDKGSPIAEWHPLVDHCHDVAACMRILLGLPGYRRRLEAVSGPLSEASIERLVTIAFLHDIGKGNAGFQSKIFPCDQRHASAPAGHVREAWMLLAPQVRKHTVTSLRIAEMEAWFRLSSDGPEMPPMVSMLHAAWSHHGTPIAEDARSFHDERRLAVWSDWRWTSLGITLAVFRAEMDRFTQAFMPGDALFLTPRFQAIFVGLLQLADWMGSNQKWFSFSMPGDPPRFEVAPKLAANALARMGMDATPYRTTFRQEQRPLQECVGIGQFRPMQQLVADLKIHGIEAFA